MYIVQYLTEPSYKNESNQFLIFLSSVSEFLTACISEKK